MNQKIKDEARERIIKRLVFSTNLSRYGAGIEADIILDMGGETDEVCDECEGTGRRRILSFPQDQIGRDGGICMKCKGKIHPKWELKLVVDGRVIE